MNACAEPRTIAHVRAGQSAFGAARADTVRTPENSDVDLYGWCAAARPDGMERSL